MNSKVSAFMNACMIDKRNRSYVCFDINDVKFLKNSTWLHRTGAAAIQMNAIPGSVELKWGFTFARMDRIVAVGYFTVREVGVKNEGD